MYIPGFRYSRDVTFDENAAFSRSRKTQEDIHEEEPKAPRAVPSKEAVREEEVQDQPDIEDRDLEEPQLPATLPHAERRKLAWVHEII